MKKPRINVRSLVYSAVGITVSGVLIALLSIQVPDVPITKTQLKQYPGGVAISIGENEYPNNWRDYRFPSPYKTYVSDYLETKTPEYGIKMPGFILGDNSYKVRKAQILAYLEKGVFKFGRWNPMLFKTLEEVLPTPETAITNTPPAVETPVATPVETNVKKGITLSLGDPIGTITLDGYTSGKLPVAEQLYKIEKIYGPIGEEFHYGLDIKAESIDGAEVYSVLPGIVTNVGFTEGEYGHYVVIKHGSVSSLYAHLQQSVPVTLNQRVLAGDVIGYVGATGDADHPHLHFEMDVDGVRFNPEIFMKEAVEQQNNEGEVN